MKKLTIVIMICLWLCTSKVLAKEFIRHKSIHISNVSTMNKFLVSAINEVSEYLHLYLKLNKPVYIIFEKDRIFKKGVIAYIRPNNPYIIYIRSSYANSLYILTILPHEFYHVYQFQNSFNSTLLDLLNDHNVSESETEVRAREFSRVIRRKLVSIFLNGFKH